MRILLRNAMGVGVALSFAASSLVVQAGNTGGTTKEALTRVAGADRAGTAVEASMILKPDDHSSKYAIVVNEDSPWDALSAGPFAAMKSAPILLTDKNSLNGVTETELDRVLKTNIGVTSAAGNTEPTPAALVYVIGGSGAVSNAVISEIEAIREDIMVERIEGLTRYDTACSVIEKMDAIRGSRPMQVFLASGESYADSMVAATYGANKTINGEHVPVLLTGDEELSNCVLNYLTQHGVRATESTPPTSPTVENVTIFGGLARIPQAVEDQVAELVTTTFRIAGENRYKTAADAAEIFFGESNPPTLIGVARGDEFADALSASVLLGTVDRAPLLLVEPTSLPFETAAYLGGHAESIKGGRIFGGTTAVSDSVKEDIEAIYM